MSAMPDVIEYVDLVDPQGVIVKRRIPRHEAGLHDGLHMQIVIVVISNADGHLLVQRRAATMDVAPGAIDHICGGMNSDDELPEHAAIREAHEETGVRVVDLRVVDKAVNEYGRYRYLLAGRSDDLPNVTDPEEVEWAAYMPYEELQRRAGLPEGHDDRLTFVDGFFEDVERAQIF